MLSDLARALVEAAPLEERVGPSVGVSFEPLATSGFSGSRHTRVRVELRDGGHAFLVLKETRPADDWMGVATGATRSREIALLDEDALHEVWEVYASPYVAWAESPAGDAGLLMRDLSPHLFPDVREPLRRDDEDLLLGSLARLHARFWGRVEESPGWLASAADYCSFLGADRIESGALERDLPPAMRATVLEGWRRALARLPRRVARRLQTPGAALQQEWARLPHTLVHGDPKVANFAVLPDRRVSAFDWALVGWAPPSVDVGWYLAVNASRLAGTKEEALAVYRDLLETELEHALPEHVWGGLESAAVLVGARTLLWSKANALEQGRAGAGEEWEWWVERLIAIS